MASCIESLMRQDWPRLHVVGVDDRSTDSTGTILDQLALENQDRLSVLHIQSLPKGWLGKPHAMAVAAGEAKRKHRPRWLLFTDADVLFLPECVRRSLAMAEAQAADHFVTLPTPIVLSAGEGMILAFLQVIGTWGVRLWRVADPAAKDAMGIGAFVLIRTSAYEEIGGFERLRMQVLEDLTLARLVKDSGLRQRLAVAPGFLRVHWAAGMRGVLNTMTKNLFAVFDFRLRLTLLAGTSLLILCLGPYAGLFWSRTRIPSLLALLGIAGLYVTAERRLSRISAGYFIAFPLSAGLFLLAIARSTAVTLREGGVTWRGTLYPLQGLREQAIKLR